MNEQERIEDMFDMYKRVTDPEEIEKNRRVRERKARMEAKKADYGL
jgi:hypothetical protein